MNPFDLNATGLMIWGLVLHLIADWPLQNDWMAQNKMKRRVDRVFHDSDPYYEGYTTIRSHWFERHPSAYVHAGIHGLLLAVIFGWVAIPLAIVHLIIDTRAPVVWWSKLVKQTQPSGLSGAAWAGYLDHKKPLAVVDVGMEVRFWTDQVFHIVCIAVAALLVG